MPFFFMLIFMHASWAQELSLKTRDVQVYARMKNCLDFTICSGYEEQLKIQDGFYLWKAQFKDSSDQIKKIFQDCRVGNKEFEFSFRDESNLVLKEVQPLTLTPSEKLQRSHLPAELFSRIYEGLRTKEPSIEILLQSGEPLTAMKSVAFEFEYHLGEYQLKSHPIPKPNVLAFAHHGKKEVVYDLQKWDGTVCRFYEVMRHEVQHVRNRRQQISCHGKHHFRYGNNDDRSAYLNDLVFIKHFCPENKALYANVESILLAMYENKKLHTCGEGSGEKGEARPEDGKGTGTAQGQRSSYSANHPRGQSERSKQALRRIKQMLRERGLHQEHYPSVSPTRKRTPPSDSGGLH
jgi:hypothetical protein